MPLVQNEMILNLLAHFIIMLCIAVPKITKCKSFEMRMSHTAYRIEMRFIVFPNKQYTAQLKDKS